MGNSPQALEPVKTPEMINQENAELWTPTLASDIFGVVDEEDAPEMKP